MRMLCCLLFLISTSCNQGSISDEQRQKLKEEKADRKIQRLTEADILNAAKSNAEKIFLEKDSSQLIWVSLSDSSITSFQKKMKEAYQYTFDEGMESFDNIEDMGDGNIVFTRSSINEDSIAGYWMILLDKKNVIIGMQ